MIKTSQGDYKAGSPFLTRPSAWGYAGVSVNGSRDGMTLVFGDTPRPKVNSYQIGTSAQQVVTVGNNSNG